jgi:two-component system response regulator YesN
MTTQKLTILIVDDEVSIRNGLCNAIPWEDLNISVLSTARDGLEAFEIIKEHKPDIVLTDIKMPICDGLSLIEKVTELHLNTKFIIISGYEDFKYAQRAIRFGVKAYLLKPIKKNELIEAVKATFDEIISEQKLNMLPKQNPYTLSLENEALKESFLSRLLQNEYRQESVLLDQISSYNINIKNAPLNVIVFTYELPDIPNNSKFSKEDNDLFKSSIINVVTELFGDIPSVTFKYENNYIITLVNVPTSINSNIINLNDFCYKCIETIKGFSNIELYAGIGDIVNSLLLSSESYRIALESLSYKLYGTEQRVFDSSIISRTNIPTISANDMNNSNLIDAIYRGNKEDTLTLINNFFDSFSYSSPPPPSFIRGMCIYLVIDVQKGLSVYFDERNDLFNEKPYNIINELHSLDQIKAWIINLFADYINEIKSSSKYKKDPIIEKAKAYISQNIFKKLKADEVAAHVNLSENYFTVYFKEKTHENFLNYITNLKMEHAKNLLKTSAKSLSEISFLLGYDDYRSFNRAFKKNIGKTPSEFRHLYDNTN